MTCQEFASIARDFTHRQWLSPEATERAAAHLQHCAACKQLFESQRALSHALHRLSEEQASLGAPKDVEQRLMAAFDARQPGKSHRLTVSKWWAIPIAAAALLAMFLVRPKPAEVEIRVAGDTERAPVLRPAPESTRVEQPAPVESPVRIAGEARPRLRSAAAAPREQATEFIPLRYGKPVESGELVQVIRMQFPRGELARLGLPVTPDAATGMVKADVLIGEDGMAKAIRFLY